MNSLPSLAFSECQFYNTVGMLTTLHTISCIADNEDNLDQKASKMPSKSHPHHQLSLKQSLWDMTDSVNK